ncbi:hypothetical protein [Aeromicrobium sp. 179-A 4D2 NHS]|uniref:hypothetical protein n=1 Tax=Aeromicrobium sp. 179-A 4D2 NHS TaxID=3142375 RepID=UPI0039A15326
MDNIEKARWADDAFDVLVTHELAEMKGYANSAFVESMIKYDMGHGDYMEIPVLAPNGTWVKVLGSSFDVRPDGTRGMLWRLHAQSSSLRARIPDAQADLFEVQRRFEDALNLSAHP